MTDAAAQVRRLLVLAGRGRPRPAIDLANGLVADGLDPRRLVLDVLTSTQEQIGELWLADTWSIAQEHAATAVVDGIVGALSTQPETASDSLGTVLVACAEEEYHSLPARMGAELLRRDGWDVVFLGASVPAEELQAYAVDAAPDAVIVSCTIGAFLTGAARSLGAAADVGLPAIAVGAAFGTGPMRARALGASGWIDTSSSFTRAYLDALPRPERRFELSPTGARLEAERDRIVQRSADALGRDLLLLDPPVEWRRRVADDLTIALRYLGVAVEIGEPALFDDYVCWWRSFLEARGAASELLDLFFTVLAAELATAGFDRLAADCGAPSGRRLTRPGA